MKDAIKRVPVLAPIARTISRTYRALVKPFPGSAEYWDRRYCSGGNSGPGSFRKLAEFKAEIVNGFVNEKNIKNIIEFGCGDGTQLKLAKYPPYTGYDVSPEAVSLCRSKFADDKRKTFRLMKDYNGETAELTLSLDVIYHLVEDEVFEQYMNRLFDSSEGYVLVYSSDGDVNGCGQADHVRHRRFTKWVEKSEPKWRLIRHIPNRYPFGGDNRTGSFADFFLFEKA